MKIGIISDVHANIGNLRRAVILLRERGAETILCAGDLVDGETEGNEAAQFVLAQKFACVQGNHDRALSGATAAHYAEWRKQWDERELGFHPWQLSNDALTDETISFLRDLPLSRSVEWEGKRILLTHASPWDQVTYVFGNGKLEHLERIAAEADADIVILGHTHVPMAVELNGVLVLNPGSVDGNRYAPYNATCALLEIPVTRYQVYDIETGRPAKYVFARLDDLGRNMHQPHE